MKVIWLILIILICTGCTNNRKIQQTGLENNLISYSDIMKQNDYHTIFNESIREVAYDKQCIFFLLRPA